MARVAWRALWVMLLVMGSGAVSEAASTDADGTYTVTITTIEASKDGGTTYSTLFSGSQAVNIASASAGATVAGLVSKVDLEAGTYNTIRVTLGSTLLLKGYVNTGGTTTIYTNNDADGFGNNAGGGVDSPGADYAASTFTIPVADRTQLFTSLSLPVSRENPRTCVVSFNTANVITDTPSIRAPSVSITSR